MEDIIRTILDVVRAQHTATEGTEEKPFDMDDIVEMTMGVMGRPEETEEEEALMNSIQKMVEAMAPDIFPPKSFEQMDDEEKTASVTSMLENRLKNGFTAHVPSKDSDSPVSEPVSEEQERQAGFTDSSSQESQLDYSSPDLQQEEPSDRLNPQETADLNDLIYRNLMDMMGVQPPQVEFPFDRSQIRYGREKSVTQQLEEEQRSRNQAGQESRIHSEKVSAVDFAQRIAEQEEPSQLSAWELAQNAVDKDVETHKKEPYVPKPVEKPRTKTASQLAAEAIARAQEEDRMKLEIEKQAEALMTEAAKRGQDPMKFALHQQEILRYMEKNSDELVSFEDYEDLSPEEKLKIERQIHIEKQIEEGVRPEEVDTEVPKEYIPAELKEQSDVETLSAEDGQPEKESKPVLSEDMLRMLSQEVISENSDMILAENAGEDMEGLQQEIFENLKQMMSGSSEPVPQEDVDDLIDQAIASNRENQIAAANAAGAETTADLASGQSQEDSFDQAQQPQEPDRTQQPQESDRTQQPEKSDRTEQPAGPKANDSNDHEAAGPAAAEEESEAARDDIRDYVDPDEIVLGEHTQAEVDEALANLATLELEGEVYERARRMLLLELAGSEAELDAWLKEQENGKKKKAGAASAYEEELDDLNSLDEDELERELELAMEEDFLQEDFPDDNMEEALVNEISTGETSKEEKQVEEKQVEEKSYQVSTRKPFVLRNSASFMDQFEDFIVDTQENRKLSTGFRKLDAMLRYSLHKGSYFIDAQPQHLKNGFMQQIADRAAEAGIDVLYISTELSRYDLMVETISRLSYEIHQGDLGKAVSAMAIMTGEDGADLASLKDELNWYRGRISEHLFILDQEAVSEYVQSAEDASAGDILTELVRSIVREGSHKPVVFIDNIENILPTEDSEDMKPLMEGMSKLAGELGIPILMSYGYAQAESEEELYPEEKEYHESIGKMCDVYMELQYADMLTEDSIPLTAGDIREMAENGESLPINVILHKNRRPMKASLQIQGTPKFHFYEE